MSKALRRCSAFLLTLTVIFALFSVTASAAGSYTKRTLGVNGIPSKYASAYTATSIYIRGNKLPYDALTINGELYVPLRAFSTAVAPGASVTYNSKTRTLTVKANGLYLTATDGAYTIYANDRPLFNLNPAVIMTNGSMYIPLSSAAKAFGVKYTLTGTVNVTGNFTPLASAASFYRSDEVFWLARIITAESQGEPLIGQIAVGNVILNRVKSPYFPNTIYGVIFDRKYGVQFTPVLNGTIYNTPTYTATLAAKICLEGFTLSSDVLYFLEPTLSTSHWIINTRTYKFTIGHHDFFS